MTFFIFYDSSDRLFWWLPLPLNSINSSSVIKQIRRVASNFGESLPLFRKECSKFKENLFNISILLSVKSSSGGCKERVRKREREKHNIFRYFETKERNSYDVRMWTNFNRKMKSIVRVIWCDKSIIKEMFFVWVWTIIEKDLRTCVVEKKEKQKWYWQKGKVLFSHSRSLFFVCVYQHQ